MASDIPRLHIGLVVSGGLATTTDLEDLPLDSLWTGGHVASRNASPEALMGLARLSAMTRRVRIGTSILLLPLYPPAIVAKQVADLDRYTGGRVILGVGVGGEYPEEFRACGVPLAERGARTDEAIPLLRRLWTGKETTHRGRYYSMSEVRIHPPPVQDGGPPIVVAGRKDVAMRRAALLGDGWMPYLYSPQRYAGSVARIREVARVAKRDLSGFEWCAFVFVNVGADGRRSREQAAAAIGGTYNQDFRAMVDRVAAVGTPDEVRATLQGFVDAGARHLVLAPATAPGEADAVVQALFADVLPGIHPSGDEPARY